MQDPFIINGIKLTILKKPEFEMVGYKKPANLGDGSIHSFIHQLTESGKMKKLSETRPAPQQIWVCLSDCQSCGLGCSGFHVCCRVCVEKTEEHDFSKFADGELFAFSIPASEWVLYETNSESATKELHKTGIYELVKEVGYKWNESIRLHFDNEHECYHNGEWIPGKIYHFLLPVVPI
mgnify:FL=1